MASLVNFAFFQVGWFACVLGASRGFVWAGPAVVILWLLAQAIVSPDRKSELLLALAAGLIGYLADSALVLAGVLAFEPKCHIGRPSPVWMVALWLNLAGTLNHSLFWLRGRWLLAAALGALGGPAAYWAGVRLGAASLHEPIWVSLAAVSVEWCLAMPILAWLAWRSSAAPSQPAAENAS